MSDSAVRAVIREKLKRADVPGYILSFLDNEPGLPMRQLLGGLDPSGGLVEALAEALANLKR